MEQIRIVADADIFSVQESFSMFGELQLVPGREIDRQSVQNADILLVRSVTRVDQVLLQGSRVRFVGTATSGVDHVDQEFLQRNGVKFCSARGCNANAVVDYCFASLSWLWEKRQVNFFDREFSLIGAGQVGGLFAAKLAKLGIRCKVHDPLLDQEAIRTLGERGIRSVDLNEALAADVVSLHVPLVRNGPYPTRHLLTGSRLAALRPGCVLVNTARGAVLDNGRLADVLRDRDDLIAILDVWETEPDIDKRLLQAVHLGTPHIAGYSIEAKTNATAMLRRSVGAFLGADTATEQGMTADHDAATPRIVDGRPEPTDHFCYAVLSRVLPLETLSERFRAEYRAGNTPPARIFDLLRRQLTTRHEFGASAVRDFGFTTRQRKFLEVMGFRLTPR